MAGARKGDNAEGVRQGMGRHRVKVAVTGWTTWQRQPRQAEYKRERECLKWQQRSRKGIRQEGRYHGRHTCGVTRRPNESGRKEAV